MSDWAHIHGYIIVGPVVKPMGKYKDDPSWKGERMYCDDNSFIGQLFTKARLAMKEPYFNEERNLEEWRLKFIHRPIEIEWTNISTLQTERELFTLPEEDIDALIFPHGSEGPMDMTIAANLDDRGLVWHIVFVGNLRDVDDLIPIKNWWHTLQKYLYISSGHIYANTSYNDETFIDTIGDSID